jgi:hypothetical protein
LGCEANRNNSSESGHISSFDTPLVVCPLVCSGWLPGASTNDFREAGWKRHFQAGTEGCYDIMIIDLFIPVFVNLILKMMKPSSLRKWQSTLLCIVGYAMCQPKCRPVIGKKDSVCFFARGPKHQNGARLIDD